MRYYLTFILVMALTIISIHAQNRAIKNRFNAGIVLAGNTSQINGDKYFGWNKFGWFTGVRGIARINRKSELVLELLYNRKGSKDPDQFVPRSKDDRFISLDYIQIPILFHRKIEGEIVGSFEFGIAYAQLFGVRINEFAVNSNYAPFAPIRDDFNKDEFLLIVGGGIFINEHIRFMGRVDYSLTLLFKSDRPTQFLVNNPREIGSLRNLQLGFGMNYIF